MNFTLMEQGGPIMWPLLGLSILGFIFFVERTLFLHKGKIRTMEFLEGIKNLVRQKRILEALTVCEETPGPIVSVVKASILNYDSDETKIRSAVQAAALVEIPTLERRIGTIAAIAKVTPMLGLLGTLIGLIQTFFLLQAEGPYANSANFAEYFAQALITTVVGIAISIMGYLAHHFLNGRVRALVHDMEWVGNNMMQFLLSDVFQKTTESENNENSAT